MQEKDSKSAQPKSNEMETKFTKTYQNITKYNKI